MSSRVTLDNPLARGYIFGCTHSTVEECLEKNLFGHLQGWLKEVEGILPGDILFLYNYNTRTLTGVFKATSQGQLNIDEQAWKQPGYKYTLFPAQVRVKAISELISLPEETYHYILRYNYKGPKIIQYRLSTQQVGELMAVFQNALEQGVDKFCLHSASGRSSSSSSKVVVQVLGKINNSVNHGGGDQFVQQQQYKEEQKNLEAKLFDKLSTEFQQQMNEFKQSVQGELNNIWGTLNNVLQKHSLGQRFESEQQQQLDDIRKQLQVIQQRADTQQSKVRDLEVGQIHCEKFICDINDRHKFGLETELLQNQRSIVENSNDNNTTNNNKQNFGPLLEADTSSNSVQEKVKKDLICLG